MKKYVDIAFIYAIVALASGVFYREFTKIIGFTGKTALGFTHLHLFALGTMMFLIIALFCGVSDLCEQKQFKKFMVSYNIGLPFMIVMFYVRGIVQALEITMSKGGDASISGIAGIAHIIMAFAIVFLFMALKRTSFTVGPLAKG